MLLPLVLATWGLVHIYFDTERWLPDLEPFIRFDLSRTGQETGGRAAFADLPRDHARDLPVRARRLCTGVPHGGEWRMGSTGTCNGDPGIGISAIRRSKISIRNAAALPHHHGEQSR
jgi:hypothetical protein